MLYARHVGSGPIVLYVHGWGHSSAIWSHVLSLSSDAYTHVAIDLPGYGKASHATSCDYRLGHLGRFVLEAATTLAEHFEKPLHAIVAHSLGGAATAVALQQERPLIIPRKLILLDCAFGGILFLKPLVILYPLLWVAVTIRRIVPRRICSVLIKSVGLLTTRPWSSMEQHFVDDVLRVNATSLVRSLYSATFRTVPIGVSPSVSECLILARGALDWICTHDMNMRRANTWGADTMTFESASHTPQIEVPQRFVDWLSDVLGSRNDNQLNGGRCQQID